jgi:hypothetical protein
MADAETADGVGGRAGRRKKDQRARRDLEAVT